MLYDRILLSSIIIGTWSLIRITEELLPDKALAYLPKPLALYALSLLIIAMAFHTIWFAFAQRRKGYFKTRYEREFETIPLVPDYPHVDIFISVFNEEKVIGRTIESLLSLNYPNYLIYLIDDHSTDKTKDILEKYKNRFPEKVHVFSLTGNEKHGKAVALNYALSRSEGELIAVFDADARVESDFLLSMVPYLEDTGVAAVQSQKRISNSSVNFLTKLQENEYCLDNYLQCGKDVIQGNVELRGNGQIIKRSVINQVGLWNEDTLTDDLELSIRLVVKGWQIRFCKESLVMEQAPLNFKALLRQRLRWCEGSLRRYLHNIQKLFGPAKETSFSQQFDSFVFLSQFAVPIWIFLDVISEIFRYVKDQESHLTSIMIISFALGVITWINLVFGIRIYRKFSWRTSMLRAIITNFYFLTIWPLIVLLTVRKVLFSRTKGIWHRTEHYSEVQLENWSIGELEN